MAALIAPGGCPRGDRFGHETPHALGCRSGRSRGRGGSENVGGAQPVKRICRWGRRVGPGLDHSISRKDTATRREGLEIGSPFDLVVEK